MNKLALSTLLLAACVKVPGKPAIPSMVPVAPEVSVTCPSGFNMVEGRSDSPMAILAKMADQGGTMEKACLKEGVDFHQLEEECKHNGGVVRVETIIGATREGLWTRWWKCSADGSLGKSDE